MAIRTLHGHAQSADDDDRDENRKKAYGNDEWLFASFIHLNSQEKLYANEEILGFLAF